MDRSSTNDIYMSFRVFGVLFEPRYIFGAKPLDQ